MDVFRWMFVFSARVGYSSLIILHFLHQDGMSVRIIKSLLGLIK